MNKRLSTIATLVALMGFMAIAPLSLATAGTLNGVFNGKSYHVNSSYDWNENNYGLGLEYEFNSQSRWIKTAMANGFRDSVDKMSYMAGGGIHRRLYETHRLSDFYVNAGVNVFMMTRQDVNDNRPFPGMLPSLSIGNKYFGMNLTYLPKAAVENVVHADMVDPTITGIVFLQFKINAEQFLP